MNMKSKVLQLVLITSCFSFGANHVATAQATNRVGIKGGLNVSNLYIDEVNDENARLGTHIGLYGQLASTDAFALQAELLFSTKGSLAQYTGFFDQEVKYNLNYLDLPLLGVFKIGETVEIHAGGYGGYLLNANISYDGDVANGVDEVDKDNLKPYDLGLLAGVGINVGAIQVGARYNYGLVKLADSDASRAWLGDAKNSCAQLFVAFNFGDK